MIRTRQPQSSLRIDWSNPLSTALAFAMTGGRDGARNVVDGKAATTIGASCTTSVSSQGKGIFYPAAASQFVDFGVYTPILTSSPSDGLGLFTLLIMSNPVSNTAGTLDGRSILFAQDRTSSGSYAIVASINTAAHTLNMPSSAGRVALAITGSGGNVEYLNGGQGASTSTLVLTTTPTWRNFVFRRNVGGHNHIFVNGINETTDSVSFSVTPAYTSTSHIIVGNRPAGLAFGVNASIPLVLGWNRALSDAEIASISSSLSAPWQLFAPSRRVVVFGAAAGGPTAYPLTAGPATATLTGTDATFVYTPASTAYPLTASAGTATFAGSAATFSWGRAVNAAAGTAALAGTAATFSKGYQVTASAGTITATGTAATFEFTGLVQYALTAEPAVVTVTGTSATFSYTGALVYTLTASSGSMTLTGRAATVGIPSASIWTDVGVSATTWSDVGPATSIWTDI